MQRFGIDAERHAPPGAYPVSKLQVQITRLGMVAEVNPLSVLSDDVLGTRVLVVTPRH